MDGKPKADQKSLFFVISSFKSQNTEGKFYSTSIYLPAHGLLWSFQEQVKAAMWPELW